MWKTEGFLYKIKKKAKMSVVIILVTVLKILATAVREYKEIKGKR